MNAKDKARIKELASNCFILSNQAETKTALMLRIVQNVNNGMAENSIGLLEELQSILLAENNL